MLSAVYMAGAGAVFTGNLVMFMYQKGEERESEAMLRADLIKLFHELDCTQNGVLSVQTGEVKVGRQGLSSDRSAVPSPFTSRRRIARCAANAALARVREPCARDGYPARGDLLLSRQGS